MPRYDQIHTERDGVPAPLPRPASPGSALGVLAAVLDHDGQQLSATQTRQQALADADHLAVLHAIWSSDWSSDVCSSDLFGAAQGAP